MPTHMETVLRAAAFAAEKHRTQRRKDIDTPFINHPIQLAYILVQADIEDPVVLSGGTSLRVALYRAFSRIWTSVPVSAAMTAAR